MQIIAKLSVQINTGLIDYNLWVERQTFTYKNNLYWYNIFIIMCTIGWHVKFMDHFSIGLLSLVGA